MQQRNGCLNAGAVVMFQALALPIAVNPVRIIREREFRERFQPMAKSLSCKDVGVPCDFTARGETTEEVLQAAAQHAKEAHGFDSIPPELMSSVMAAMRDE
jgi:predicted small metal-binding protein